MQAYHLEQPGSVDGLLLREHPAPQPGPGQVLVRVFASALNYRDLMVLRGYAVGPALKPAVVPLSDGAGEVVEVGEGVGRFRPGDRVAAIFRQNWLAGEFTHEGGGADLGAALDGMLAEYVVLHEEGLVRLPPHLSYEEGATLACAGVTAWNAVVGKGRTVAGDTVLVQGSGGVSLFALQFAKALGARVIATTSSDHKAERLRALGADQVVNYNATPDWDAEVLRLTEGRGADVVVEVGGAGTLPKSVAAARVGGRVVLVGLLTQGRDTATVSELFLSLFLRDITLSSVHVGSRQDFEAMNRAIAQNGLHPTIDRRFPFAAAPDAFRYLESGAHFGKVVISHG